MITDVRIRKEIADLRVFLFLFEKKVFNYKIYALFWEMLRCDNLEILTIEWEHIHFEAVFFLLIFFFLIIESNDATGFLLFNESFRSFDPRSAFI